MNIPINSSITTYPGSFSSVLEAVMQKIPAAVNTAIVIGLPKRGKK
jgi:hypothetical protein